MSTRERALIARTHQEFGLCLTPEHLKHDFEKLGIRSGMTLLVHSSLSKIGWICGGPVTVIQVLLDLLGSDGTLLMPCHCGDNCDPQQWENPPVPSEWFDVIRQCTPAYQPDITPTFSMGKIVETFRHWPGVRRSEHPRYSVIGSGPQARTILDQHIDSCGEQSPLARLYDCADDGYVLLLGVLYGNNTSLHLSEYRHQADLHAEKTAKESAAIWNPQTNSRQWFEWNDYEYSTDDFDEIGNAFESIEGNVRSGQVGLAPCRLMKQYQLVDFALDWMKKNRLSKKT